MKSFNEEKFDGWPVKITRFINVGNNFYRTNWYKNLLLMIFLKLIRDIQTFGHVWFCLAHELLKSKSKKIIGE